MWDAENAGSGGLRFALNNSSNESRRNLVLEVWSCALGHLLGRGSGGLTNYIAKQEKRRDVKFVCMAEFCFIIGFFCCRGRSMVRRRGS